MIFCSFKILNALFKTPGDFELPAYTILYGTLYTQYRGDPTVDEENCIWFFLFQIIFDFLRALIVGLGQRSAIVQIVGLLITELICLILLIRFKPFKTPLMNKLKIFISVVQFVILCLLAPFIGNTPLLYKVIIDIIMKGLQFILTILVTAFAILGLVLLAKKLIGSNKEEEE